MLPKAGPKGTVLGTASINLNQVATFLLREFPSSYLYMYLTCLSKIAADNYLEFSVSTCVCSSGRFFRFIVIIIPIHIIHFTFSLHYCEIVQGHNSYNNNKRRREFPRRLGNPTHCLHASKGGASSEFQSTSLSQFCYVF